ncbi:ribonuclease P protein component [Rubritalea marina]|uniref:ribonuclease P protein component n=1 Tax=Rubritalea marina TaxID=361055 RepID=UPI000A001644|nr:ribonuclease P protein component [Rubritalea marina]
MRLPRKFSMKSRAEFAQVRELGRSRSGRYLVVSVLESDELEHFKYGLITTKKIGKAHQRNYLRRVVRSIMSDHGGQVIGNRYVVTILRWRAPEATYEQLEREWLKLARKLGALQEEES